MSAGVLKGALEPDAIHRLVNARYPEATPLPQRPALDTLLLALEYAYDPASNAHVRKGESAASSLATQAVSWTHARGPSGRYHDSDGK